MDSCTVKRKHDTHTNTQPHTYTSQNASHICDDNSKLVKMCEEKGRGTKTLNELASEVGRRSET